MSRLRNVSQMSIALLHPPPVWSHGDDDEAQKLAGEDR
jgi:hypothetical protein